MVMKAVVLCQKTESDSFLVLDMNTEIKRKNQKALLLILLMLIAVLIMAVVCTFVGSSNMTVKQSLDALIGKGTSAHERIIWNIRIPRVLAAIISGAGLSLSGLIMQTTLNNSMASPSTLGVSNAAVFGANLSIIAFAGGFLSTGNNLTNYIVGANPYSTSLMAFLFSALSVLLILSLCKLRSFSPNVVVLAGIAVGSVWTAATTVLQFYATDVGLSAAVVWSFGDLGRATYKTDAIMFAVVLLSVIFFQIMSWRFNVLLSGEQTAKSMGVHVEKLRFISIMLASIITAVCVSFLGVIGFVGIICPHITKKLLGQDHRFAIPMSVLSGSLLLLLSDTFSRSIGNGSALPVGAITSLLGAQFFIAIIFSRKENRRC
ncbi:MAG: FecCD family ABC transporter permease [Acutalibacteraceae bacterium]